MMIDECSQHSKKLENLQKSLLTIENDTINDFVSSFASLKSHEELTTFFDNIKLAVMCRPTKASIYADLCLKLSESSPELKEISKATPVKGLVCHLLRNGFFSYNDLGIYDKIYSGKTKLYLFAPEMERDASIEFNKLVGELSGESRTEFEKLRENNYSLLNKLRMEGCNHSSVAEALRNDDVKAFKSMIDSKLVQINQNIGRSEYETNQILMAEPPLISYAAFYGSNNCINFLIEMKCKTNKADRFGRLPFHYSAAGGHLDTVEMLCASKKESGILNYAMKYHQNLLIESIFETSSFNLSQRQKIFQNETILSSAVSSSNYEGFRICLDHGFDINDGDSINGSALIYSVKTDNINFARFLCSFSSLDPNTYSPEGMSALAIAEANHKTDFINLLSQLPNIDLKATSNEGFTPLHLAIHMHNLQTVKYLLSLEWISPNELDKEGRTPLHLAAQWGAIDIVKYLLTLSNVDPNRTDKSGWTALHYAFNLGNQELIKILIEKTHFSPNDQDKNGLTLLHIAARKNNIEAIKILLSIPKIQVNKQDNVGNSALHWAAFHGNKEAMDLLLKVPGIDYEMRNISGLAAYQIGTRPKDYHEEETHYKRRLECANLIPH